MNQAIERFIIFAASIILLVAVIGVAFLGLSQGRNIFNGGIAEVEQRSTISQVEMITELERTNTLPTASVYVLLQRYGAFFDKCTCHKCNTVTTAGDIGSCLKNHLKGRLSITLSKNENEHYEIVLS